MDLLITTFASVEDRAPFVGTPQLQRIISHLLPAALRACLLYRSVSLYISRGKGLHRRTLGSQCRRKGRGLGACGDSLR